MKEQSIEQIIRQSTDPETLITALNHADEEDLIEKLTPEQKRESESFTKHRAMGRLGIGGFNF